MSERHLFKNEHTEISLKRHTRKSIVKSSENLSWELKMFGKEKQSTWKFNCKWTESPLTEGHAAEALHPQLPPPSPPPQHAATGGSGGAGPSRPLPPPSPASSERRGANSGDRGNGEQAIAENNFGCCFLVVFLFFKQALVVLERPGNKGKAENKSLQLYPAYRQGSPHPGTQTQPAHGQQRAGSRLSETPPEPARSAQGEGDGRTGGKSRGRRVSKAGLGGARPPGCSRAGGLALSPRPPSACETPLAHPHGRSLSPLPD